MVARIRSSWQWIPPGRQVVMDAGGKCAPVVSRAIRTEFIQPPRAGKCRGANLPRDDWGFVSGGLLLHWPQKRHQGNFNPDAHGSLWGQIERCCRPRLMPDEFRSIRVLRLCSRLSRREHSVKTGYSQSPERGARKRNVLCFQFIVGLPKLDVAGFRVVGLVEFAINS